jgi:hypothetical protein
MGKKVALPESRRRSSSMAAFPVLLGFHNYVLHRVKRASSTATANLLRLYDRGHPSRMVVRVSLRLSSLWYLTALNTLRILSHIVQIINAGRIIQQYLQKGPFFARRLFAAAALREAL